MVDPVWEYQFSIECSVPVEFAWGFWTNPENWALDPDVQSVRLHGPFAAGTQGLTVSKSAGQIEWRIADVQPRRAVLEFPAPGAMATFVWTFADSGTGTRMTQHAMLSGLDAAKYIDTFGRSLEEGIPAGMRRLRGAMREAAQSIGREAADETR